MFYLLKARRLAVAGEKAISEGLTIELIMLVEEHRKISSTLLILVALCLLQCKQNSNVGTSKINPQNSDWTTDSIGCLGLRTRDLALKMIKQNNLMYNNRVKFINIFKHPNKVEKTKDWEILTYYMGNLCENGHTIPNSDKCYAKFYIKDDRLIDLSFTCE